MNQLLYNFADDYYKFCITRKYFMFEKKYELSVIIKQNYKKQKEEINQLLIKYNEKIVDYLDNQDSFIKYNDVLNLYDLMNHLPNNGDGWIRMYDKYYVEVKNSDLYELILRHFTIINNVIIKAELSALNEFIIRDLVNIIFEYSKMGIPIIKIDNEYKIIVDIIYV